MAILDINTLIGYPWQSIDQRGENRYITFIYPTKKNPSEIFVYGLYEVDFKS
jgi:hypothetical protein